MAGKNSLQNKPPHHYPEKGFNPKEIAAASEPPVVVPLVVVAVAVHVALVVLVESQELCNLPSISVPLEYS